MQAPTTGYSMWDNRPANNRAPVSDPNQNQPQPQQLQPDHNLSLLSGYQQQHQQHHGHPQQHQHQLPHDLSPHHSPTSNITAYSSQQQPPYSSSFPNTQFTFGGNPGAGDVVDNFGVGVGVANSTYHQFVDINQPPTALPVAPNDVAAVPSRFPYTHSPPIPSHTHIHQTPYNPSTMYTLPSTGLPLQGPVSLSSPFYTTHEPHPNAKRRRAAPGAGVGVGDGGEDSEDEDNFGGGGAIGADIDVHVEAADEEPKPKL